MGNGTRKVRQADKYYTFLFRDFPLGAAKEEAVLGLGRADVEVEDALKGEVVAVASDVGEAGTLVVGKDLPRNQAEGEGSLKPKRRVRK